MVFHANQTSKCLDPHLIWGWGWRSVRLVWTLQWSIFTDRSKAVLLFMDHLCSFFTVFVMLLCASVY